MFPPTKKYFQRLFPYLVLGGGALDVLFWILYSARVIAPSETDATLVKAFESAFPIADGLMGLMLFGAGLGLLKQKPSGTFFLVAAAAMAIYLGILDVTFYAQQGLYLPLTLSTLFLLGVNGCCICGGTIGLWFGWKHWRKCDANLSEEKCPNLIRFSA